MNAKQRNKNRKTAAKLEYIRHTCPECGQRGKHWIQMPQSLFDLFSGVPAQGFWTCDKFYGPDGRRLDSRFQSETHAMIFATNLAEAIDAVFDNRTFRKEES